jgi:hypothetical protein
MEIFYFIAFVVACVLLVAWMTDKSKKQNAKLAAKRKTKAKTQQTERLSTPSDYLLSNRDHVWQKKRAMRAEDVIVTNRFAPRSQSKGEPEYDGFSRRDRHHVVVGTAYIKKEDHIDDLSKTAVENKKTQFSK